MEKTETLEDPWNVNICQSCLHILRSCPQTELQMDCFLAALRRIASGRGGPLLSDWLQYVADLVTQAVPFSILESG